MTMMQVKATIEGTDRIYQVDLTETPLGAGATAVVRRGVSSATIQTDPYQIVAVKIAYHNTPRPQLDQFKYEYKLLKKLASTGHVPRAFLGNALRGDGQLDETLSEHIIIQEFIPAEHELRRFAADDHRLPVDIALASAHQYATLLQAMHEKNIVSMGDRKATDLRWLAKSVPPRLVVLDWNRAREVSLSEKPALVRQDIQVFGRLWAEQVLARDVRELPDVDDTSDPTWASLRRALRVILKHSLGSRSTWGYQTAVDILKDIDDYQKDEQKSCQRLIEEADNEQKKGVANPTERVYHAQRILTLLDWAETRQEEVSEHKGSIETLKLWVYTSLSEALHTVEPAIELIKKNLDKRRGYYDEALHVYSKIRPSISAISLADHLALLRLTRWAIVSEIGNSGLNLGLTMGDPVDYLMACVEALENSSVEDAHTQYHLFSEWVEQQNKEELTQLKKVSSPLLNEIKIRQALTPTNSGE